MPKSEGKLFAVDYNFLMSGSTRCLTIRAKDAEDALRKCREAIKPDGFLDGNKFRALGGDDSQESWKEHAGTDYDYSIDEDGIEEIEEVE